MIFYLKNRVLFILLSFVFSFTSCKKASETASISGNLISSEDGLPIANTRIYIVQALDYTFSHPKYEKDADSMVSGLRGVKLFAFPYESYYYFDSTITDQNGFFELSYDLHAVSRDNSSDAQIDLYVQEQGKWTGQYTISEPTINEIISNWKVYPKSTIKLCVKDSGLNQQINTVYLNDNYAILHDTYGISETTIFQEVNGNMSHEIKYYKNQTEIIDSIFCPTHDTVTYSIFI